MQLETHPNIKSSHICVRKPVAATYPDVVLRSTHAYILNPKLELRRLKSPYQPASWLLTPLYMDIFLMTLKKLNNLLTQSTSLVEVISVLSACPHRQ